MIFIKENWEIILLVCLPIVYFICRDIYLSLKDKKKLEQQKKALIESEKKLEVLINKMEENKKMLMDSLIELDVNSILIESEKNEPKKPS